MSEQELAERIVAQVFRCVSFDEDGDPWLDSTKATRFVKDALATVTAERDQYKQKADTLDMLLELMQSFEGVSTADLSRTDAYIAAWQKLKSERDQLQQRVAELEKSTVIRTDDMGDV